MNKHKLIGKVDALVTTFFIEESLLIFSGDKGKLFYTWGSSGDIT